MYLFIFSFQRNLSYRKLYVRLTLETVLKRLAKLLVCILIVGTYITGGMKNITRIGLKIHKQKKPTEKNSNFVKKMGIL